MFMNEGEINLLMHCGQSSFRRKEKPLLELNWKGENYWNTQQNIHLYTNALCKFTMLLLPENFNEEMLLFTSF